MNQKLFFYSILYLLLSFVLITACEDAEQAKDGESSSIVDSTANVTPLTDADIQSIQHKYAVIDKTSDYKTTSIKVKCDERTLSELTHKYDEDGTLVYMELEECGEHGCSVKKHYYSNGELVYIFEKKDFSPGTSSIIEEHQTYFKDGVMIQCLEKKASYHGGESSIEELLKKAENKDVDCTPERLTKDLSRLESLTVDEAQNYFCASSNKMFDTFSSIDGYKHLEVEPFECECAFSVNGGNKAPSIFISDMEEKACVKVDGELNALYPDWEKRDYKKELQQLSTAKTWISIKDDNIKYFGKPLSTYKYESPLEFLTDVILASGENIEEISIQSSSDNGVAAKMERLAQKAIAKAKAYKAKGGNDPLTIVKYDNKSYDVFVRYRQTTQYEGKITLLKNRAAKILKTTLIKGTCGC